MPTEWGTTVVGPARAKEFIKGSNVYEMLNAGRQITIDKNKTITDVWDYETKKTYNVLGNETGTREPVTITTDSDRESYIIHSDGRILAKSGQVIVGTTKRWQYKETPDGKIYETKQNATSILTAIKSPIKDTKDRIKYAEKLLKKVKKLDQERYERLQGTEEYQESLREDKREDWIKSQQEYINQLRTELDNLNTIKKRWTQIKRKPKKFGYNPGKGYQRTVKHYCFA